MDLAHRVLARFQRTAGANDFEDFIAHPDVHAAFKRAVQEARHESGHGGYTGTIAEKSNFEIRRREPMSFNAARDFANKDVEHNDKWGPAFAVPVAESKPGKPVKMKTVVEARDEGAAKNQGLEKIKAEYEAQHRGESATVKTLEAKMLKGPMAKAVAQPVVKESVFFWKSDKGTASGRSYKTKQEAISIFKKMGPESRTSGELWTLFETRPLGSFRFEGGAPLQWQVIAEVTPESTIGPIRGWLFYGYASS